MGEIASIQPSQVDVREQYIDGLLSEDEVGLLGTGGAQDCKTCLLERLGCHRPDKQVILNDENTGAACLCVPALRL